MTSLIKTKFIPILLLVLSSFSLVNAEELKPLDKVIYESSNSYPFKRCSGLYAAIMKWGGKEKYGEETYNRYTQGAEKLLFSSISIDVKEGVGKTDEVTKNNLNTVIMITEKYIERFKNNYASTGQPFGEDEMFKKDLNICTKLSNLLN